MERKQNIEKKELEMLERRQKIQQREKKNVANGIVGKIIERREKKVTIVTSIS